MNWRSNLNKRIVLDNGSHKIRIGTAASQKPIQTWLNMIAIDKTNGNKLIGQQLLKTWDETKLIYEKPNIRGATIKFDQQLTLWEQIITKIDEVELKKTGFDLFDFSLTFPLHPYLPQSILVRYFEIFFQHFNFEAVLPYQASTLLYQKAKKDYGNKVLSSGFQLSNKFAVVVESSQSATYITPFMDNQIVKNGIKRIDVGGKLLTNWLKEILSFRYLDLKNSDILIRQIKQDLCYVSHSFVDDMKSKKGILAKHFILPDQQLMKRGYATDTWDPNSYSQKITLDKQRIQIPQILFNPQDISLDQCGIVEGIFQSLEFADPSIKHNFLQNIIISGGNTLFPNFKQRLYRQLRQNSPSWMKPKMFCMNQKNELFQAAVDYTKKSNFSDKAISKSQYRQMGFSKLNLL